MNKLIIEVRQNELRRKAENPNIPYTSAEIIESALDAYDEGATIAHFHPRNEAGAEVSDLESAVEIIGTIRSRSSMLVHPTLGHFDHGDDPLLRLSNVEALAAMPSMRPDIAPLDLGSLNFDAWNPESKEFIIDNWVYQNSARDLRSMARRLRELGVKPQLVIYGLSGIRLMDAFIATGDVDTPTYVSFVLGGPPILFGHPATSNGLRAYLDNMTHANIHWNVMIAGGSYLPLLPEIIEAGGHICIGLGDYAFPELGVPTNAEVVRKVVEIARGMGRDIASPEEVRAMLNVQAPASA